MSKMSNMIKEIKEDLYADLESYLKEGCHPQLSDNISAACKIFDKIRLIIAAHQPCARAFQAAAIWHSDQKKSNIIGTSFSIGTHLFFIDTNIDTNKEKKQLWWIGDYHAHGRPCFYGVTNLRYLGDLGQDNTLNNPTAPQIVQNRLRTLDNPNNLNWTGNMDKNPLESPQNNP